VEDVILAALIERLGLGGREMTASGHSKDFVLKVVQPSRLLLSRKAEMIRVVKAYHPDDGLP
jgi:hypothetical protein